MLTTAAASRRTFISLQSRNRPRKTFAQTIYAAPDPEIPAQADRVKGMAVREFRVNRLRQRISDMEHRKQQSEEAGRLFEEKRIARKALNLLNYERKIRATQ